MAIDTLVMFREAHLLNHRISGKKEIDCISMYIQGLSHDICDIFSFVGCATEWIGFGFDQYRGRVFQSGTAGVNGVRTPWTTADQDKDVTRTFLEIVTTSGDSW